MLDLQMTTTGAVLLLSTLFAASKLLPMYQKFTADRSNLNRYRIIDLAPKNYGFQIIFLSFERPVLFWAGPLICILWLSLLEMFGMGPTPLSVMPYSVILAIALAYPLFLVGSALALVQQSYYYGEASDPVSKET